LYLLLHRRQIELGIFWIAFAICIFGFHLCMVSAFVRGLIALLLIKWSVRS
jgi:hypothetical protein